MLADPVAHGGRAEDAFHVVCPSLPGYGFSGPTRETGWDIRRVAESTAALMARGVPKIAQKTGEEAVETVIAAMAGDKKEIAAESADLLYHLLVLLEDNDLQLADLATELANRHN